jgi:hypothetical protein
MERWKRSGKRKEVGEGEVEEDDKGPKKKKWGRGREDEGKIKGVGKKKIKNPVCDVTLDECTASITISTI